MGFFTTSKKGTGKSLKIGIVCYPSVGGSGIVATGLGSELAKRGHEVHFLSYDPPFALDRKLPNIFFHKVDFNGYELFKYPDYTLPLAVRIVDVCKEFKLDILHVHYAVPHATAALLAKDIADEEKIPFPNIITTLHGTDITLLARDKTVMPVIKYSIESSCGVTAVSESLKKDTIKNLDTKKHIEVIHNFYTPKPVAKSAEEVRKEIGVADTDFLAIHLSNLRKVKRIPDLLAILGKVKENKKIKLLILAGADFAPFKPLVEELGIGDQIIIKRNVLDIENYINAADIGIYTSETESFGMGILETMSYGKPVLATNAGGISEVLQDGKTGYLFGVGKVDDFAKKLLELSYDESLVKKIGENAKERARSNFCSEKIVAQYEEYYRKIISSCG
ncbi:MAG: N-acetyl-alpha-D-glucosaminyl L-malate synthase BshA [Candidatus Pacebacteria bacterium]|nr:N-acetyl-alpha-D-glucosaminyl L-malate synthase BshA [Candidatus Paceibacterota bacterium]